MNKIVDILKRTLFVLWALIMAPYMLILFVISFLFEYYGMRIFFFLNTGYFIPFWEYPSYWILTMEDLILTPYLSLWGRIIEKD